MLKIYESVDNNIHRSNKEKEEKEPGFKRLEPYKKNLILNASALPQYLNMIQKLMRLPNLINPSYGRRLNSKQKNY